ncbi:MAG: Fis family transcriptional regulator [Holosporaceae bacterium]|jgi:two-component system nitrogen regulation response regulator GlnG|nr:Fis family transcriptional regulator [Holosporaceae bacterium]
MLDSTENSEVGFSKMIEKRLEEYFDMHKGGEIPPGLYRRVLTEVERALFDTTIKRSKGNQLKAAKMLGINRGTLRKKITNLGGNDI